MAFPMKIYLLSQGNHSATELTGISVSFTGSRRLPTFGPHPGASVLDWCVWKRWVECNAVSLWHVRLRCGAGGQGAAPARVTPCTAHFTDGVGCLRQACFCRLSAAEDNFWKFSLWSWTLRATGQEFLKPSALWKHWGPQKLLAACKLCCWLWRRAGTEMLTTDVFGYETDKNWPPRLAEHTLRVHISNAGIDKPWVNLLMEEVGPWTPLPQRTASQKSWTQNLKNKLL